jgi:hypothetical protein
MTRHRIKATGSRHRSGKINIGHAREIWAISPTSPDHQVKTVLTC